MFFQSTFQTEWVANFRNMVNVPEKKKHLFLVTNTHVKKFGYNLGDFT